MKNLKTTLVSVAALSAVALTSYAQNAQPAVTVSAAPAAAVAPAAKTVSTTVYTKYGKIKVTDTETENSDIFNIQTPTLPANVNNVDLLKTLVAVAMSLTDEITHQDALKAFAASIPSLNLGDMGGKSVVMNATFPNAGKSNIEVIVGKASAAFAPEVSKEGQVTGNVVVTDARGAQTAVAVDVKSTGTGVTGTVGGSAVTSTAPSASAVTATPPAPVATPDAQTSISAAESSSNDTVGEGKGVISPNN